MLNNVLSRWTEKGGVKGRRWWMGEWTGYLLITVDKVPFKRSPSKANSGNEIEGFLKTLFKHFAVRITEEFHNTTYF